MTFKEYTNEKLVQAMSNPNFEINGNSPRATFHKSFLNVLKDSTKTVFNDILYIIKDGIANVTLAEALALVIVVPTFPLFVCLKAVIMKRKAKKELLKEYENSLTNN